MKHFTKINLALVLGASLLMASCKDDPETSSDDKAFDAKYSDVTTEQSKQDVETAGIQLVGELDALESEEAIDVMAEMMDLMSSQPQMANEFNIPLQAAKIISSENKSKAEVFQLLKSATAQRIALLDSFKMHVAATYTYDFELQDFVETENADALVIKFPGKSTDLTNTAEIFVGNLTVKDITSPNAQVASEIGSIQLPTGLDATLTYNGNVIMSHKLEAAYMNDGVPTKIYNTLTVGTFQFAQMLDHSQYKSAAFKFSLTHDDKTLIAFGAEVNGNWTQSNIEENTIEGVEIEEIINEGNAFVQFMNLKAVGKVNIKGIIDGEQAFEMAHLGDMDGDGYYTDEYYKAKNDNLVSLIEKYAKFVLVYDDTNTLIAYVQPFSDSETKTDYYDGFEYTYTDYYVDFEMVFKDDSSVDMSAFVDNELTDFFSELNSFISRLNADYGTTISEIDTTGGSDV